MAFFIGLIAYKGFGKKLKPHSDNYLINFFYEIYK